jgi:hypothetical protein
MSDKRMTPNQGKQVQCYMDIKIGPRFAGRMVFEVRACVCACVCLAASLLLGGMEGRQDRAHTRASAPSPTRTLSHNL